MHESNEPYNFAFVWTPWSQRIHTWSFNGPNPLTEKPKSILEEAMDVTRNSRQEEYAHPLINFIRTGDFWTTYLRGKGRLADEQWITPVDVAWMMVLMKVARAIETHKHDTVVDTAGYADCIGRIDQYMKELGYEDGVKAFDTMTEAEALDLMNRVERD